MFAPDSFSPREAGIGKARRPSVQINNEVEPACQEPRRRSELSFGRQSFSKIGIAREAGSEPFLDKGADTEGWELFLERADG